MKVKEPPCNAAADSSPLSVVPTVPSKAHQKLNTRFGVLRFYEVLFGESLTNQFLVLVVGYLVQENRACSCRSEFQNGCLQPGVELGYARQMYAERKMMFASMQARVTPARKICA